MRIEYEKDIVCAMDHRGQDGLHQEVIGIDEDVIGLEAVEGEHKLHHGNVGVAKQGMTETDPGMRYGRWNDLRPQRDQAVFGVLDVRQNVMGWILWHNERGVRPHVQWSLAQSLAWFISS